MDEEIEELEQFLDLEGTEFAEACFYMCNLHRRMEYIGNEELNALLEAEIKNKLKYFKERFKIIEKECTNTYKTLELEEL